MSPETGEAGGCPTAGPDTPQVDHALARQLDSRDGSAPQVSAAVYAPAGRRQLPLVVVADCPFCSHAHSHREAEGVRRAGCGLGRYVPRPAEAAVGEVVA